MPDVEIPHPDEVAERAADPFARRVALVVAGYAVGLAVASFGGHNAGKDMMMAKQEEANLWNRYQSKATREALYRSEVLKLEADRDAGGTLPPARERLLGDYRTQAARMEADKAVIEEDARAARAEVRLAQRRDPYFDFAEVGFQIAIVLASVAMLAGNRWAFHASLAVAGVALLLSVNGFGLFVAVPGLDAVSH